MIANLRALRGQGLVSSVGEYTPNELWDALDEIEQLRTEKSTFQKLVREAYEFVYADLPNDGLSKLLELMDAVEMESSNEKGEAMPAAGTVKNEAAGQSRSTDGLGGLSTRARNVLTRVGLNTVDEVRAEWRRREPNGFIREPNCGKMANAEIRKWAGVDTAAFPARDIVLAIDLLTLNGYVVLPPNNN